MEWQKLGSDIDGEASDDFSGWSVSLSADGTRVAIGSINNGEYKGHVRIYELTNGDWVQMGSDIDGEALGDSSGYSISLSADGTRVAIGATNNDGTGSTAGHVRIYEFSITTNTWLQLGPDINGEAEDDSSGYSVSLSADGTRVAIGAPYNDGTGGDAGHVRIYEFSDATSDWMQMGSDINGEATDDQSGESVSLSGDGTRVAIGASRNDGVGNSAGHVRIYEFSSGAWSQLGTDIDGTGQYNSLGYLVSLNTDGTIVAISINQGVAIYDYNNSSNAWSQLGADINSSGTITLSGDGLTLAIGAPYNNGNVQIYKFSSGAWSQLGADINGEASGDYSGWSVSLSADGSRVAIGALFNDPTINGATTNDAGHVRIYELVSTTTTEAPTHQTILSLESVGTSMNGTTGKTNYVWQLKANTTPL